MNENIIEIVSNKDNLETGIEKALPIIKNFDFVAIHRDVKDEITKIRLNENKDDIPALKRNRAAINKIYKPFQDQMKMVKAHINKPLMEFGGKVKAINTVCIKQHLDELNEIINKDTELKLNKKIGKLKEFFNEKNTNDFINFDDMGLKIINSGSDREYKKLITEYIENINAELKTIASLQHKNRILAKYQLTGDLNFAISQTNIEIEKELEIEKTEELKTEAKEFSQESHYIKFSGCMSEKGFMDKYTQVLKFAKSLGLKYEEMSKKDKK